MKAEAFILVGGRSTRFGRDKATYQIDGRPMALHVSDAIRLALPKARITLIASAPDSAAGIPETPVIEDIIPGFGPWSGLHAALATSVTHWTFIAACDLVCLSAGLLSSIARTAEVTEASLVVPRQPDGRLQPLCAFYRTKAALPAVLSTIESGGRLPPLEALSKILPTAIVEVPNGETFINVNTPADLLTTKIRAENATD